MVTDFESRRRFRDMILTTSAEKIRDEPNAGGNSVVSEALSCEMLTTVFGAKLMKVRNLIGVQAASMRL